MEGQQRQDATCRQRGKTGGEKTASILQFAHDNYKNVVAINFVLQQKYKAIFDDGYEVDDIVRNLTLIDPSIKIEDGNTRLFREYD